MRAFVPYLPPAKTVAGSSGGGGSFDYIGANAIGAYSVVALKTDVTRCFRVRRSSDNTEQDCLTLAEAVAFCGGGSGYVVRIYDQSGSNDLIQSTTTLQPRVVNAGVADSGALLDGVNDYVSGSSTGGMIAPNMSFGGWFNVTSTNAALITKGLNNQWGLFYEGGLRLRIGNSGADLPASAPASGWNHIFATVSGTTGTIYVNGAQVATGTVNAMPAANTDQVQVGVFVSFFYAAMHTYDVRVYNVAKTAGEIAVIYASVTPT